jgi:hypothetical protein
MLFADGLPSWRLNHQSGTPAAIGVLRRRLEIGQRQVRRLRGDVQDLLDRLALRDGELQHLPAGLAVEQEQQRIGGAHLLAQLVDAGLDLLAARVVLGRLDERLLALDHVEPLEFGADVRGRLVLQHLDGDLAGAAGVVVGRVEEVAELVEAVPDAAGERRDDDQRHEQRDGGAPAASATGAVVPGPTGGDDDDAARVRTPRRTPGRGRQSSRSPPLRVEPALQDLHRGRLVDHRALAPPPDATLTQPTRRDHGRHPFVGEPNRYGVDDCR